MFGILLSAIVACAPRIRIAGVRDLFLDVHPSIDRKRSGVSHGIMGFGFPGIVAMSRVYALSARPWPRVA